MDRQGRILIAWSSAWTGSWPAVYNRLFVHRFAADGDCICETGDQCPAPLSVEESNVEHALPSVALSADGYASVRWLGHRMVVAETPDTVLGSSFEFDLSPFVPPTQSPPESGAGDHHPSAGVSDYFIDDWNFYTFAWARLNTLDPALVYMDPVGAEIRPITECGSNGIFCFQENWQPCVAMRSTDGVFAIIWAMAEQPTEEFSPFDIKLQLYGTNGLPIGDELTVNQPISELATSEESPALAFDDDGDLVAVWIGRQPYGCEPGQYHVYARRLFWNESGTPQGTPQFESDQFIVDSDPQWPPIGLESGNPTVALSMDAAHPGKFVIAWNVQDTSALNHAAVHAQYFDADGAPVGQEFRLNQTYDIDFAHKLANSGQHTLAYGADGQVVATWSKYDDTNSAAYFTILPDGFAETTGDSCCKADVNGDGERDGRDIQAFVDLLLSDSSCLNIVEMCPADTNNDAAVTTGDIPSFVFTLLDGVTCGSRSGGNGLNDCNNNGTPDANDIFNCSPEDPSCQDCNANWIPDECDIASETSADVDADGIPDECEPDCNKNDVPDDWDIDQQTSDDVNGNGIPDECEPDCNSNSVPDAWDISQTTSADCNENGIPDECEPDCNSNGIPDDCDLDPTDPDGDEWVSPDCNENEFPDECDITLGPPWGSLDVDEDGIPDECEEEDFRGGGEEGMMMGYGSGDSELGGPCDGLSSAQWYDDPTCAAAWGEFIDWSLGRTWGPASSLTGLEQYQAMVEKLNELGLPNPWAR